MTKSFLVVGVVIALVAVACDKTDADKSGVGSSAAGSVGSSGSGSAPSRSAVVGSGGSAVVGVDGSAAGSATVSATTGSAAGSAATGSAAGSAGQGFKVGDLVFGLWPENNQWYPGKIGAVNADGTYRVNYSDGDVSPKLAAKRIKPRTASAPTGATGGCAGGLTSCGGRCVNLYTDRNNCFQCGRLCPEGTECRGGGCATPL